MFAFAGLAAGCGERTDPAPEPAEARPAGIITLGDIDPDEPATRVRRIQPLADLLGERLADHGIGRGRVIIARNIMEMARLMRDGEVDLFLDSPYPILAVNRESGSESLLLRQAKEDAEYWTEFIARKDSGVESLADLKGQVAVFQEPHSTSGFLLPVSALLDQGYSLQAVPRLDSEVDADHVGCHFSGDEENTIELVLNGNALVGVVSNQDFRELPEQTRERLTIIARTEAIPRQLVAVRPGIDPELVHSVSRILLELTDEDRARMAAQDAPRGWTWRFAPLTDATRGVLAGVAGKMDALPACVAAR